MKEKDELNQRLIKANHVKLTQELPLENIQNHDLEVEEV
jgi:hypothetical protein